MNTQLTNHFLGITYHPEEMHEVAHADIIPALNKHFGYQWAWEVTDEKLIMDGTMVSTTVALYIPGRVLTGRSLVKIKDYGENHLYALANACSSIFVRTEAPKNEASAPVNTQMTPDQIMSMVGGPAPQTPTQPSVQSIPFDDPSIPFTMGPDINPTPAPQPYVPTPQAQQPMANASYTQPNPALNGYSQCQVDRMNRVKQALDIINDTMLGNWISTWNSAFSSKKDLNPMNIDKFLDWAEDFAKNM